MKMKKNKKGYMGGGMISPRKSMAMGYNMGGDVDIKRAMGLASAMAKDPDVIASLKGDATNSAGAFDDAMRMKRNQQMSSGGVRPVGVAMNKGGMV
tara:strand:+ start:190 stop:477 length:288 start_codon:yes stop_codon:yes gene_type:complete